jgi:hypothetical protein
MLIENLDILNRKLADVYGKTEDKPNYRIVWSDDQLEKRVTDRTNEGFLLLHPEVREMPKYKQWIHDKYVLETLVIVPKQTDLIEPLSYEPLWVFQSSMGVALAPNWLACKKIIETVNENIRGAGNYRKYKDPEEGLTEAQLREKREAELNELTEALFPNENDTTDALHYKEGISVPPNYRKVEIE